MESVFAGGIAQRLVGKLLKCNCLRSQALHSTTAFGRRIEERDSNSITAYEGHNTIKRIYQASCARLVFSTAATDRPVYPHFIYWENQQPTITRHNRFYCTAKTTRKKMVKLQRKYFI